MKLTLDDVNVYAIHGTSSWAWRMKNNFMGGSAYPSKESVERIEANLAQNLAMLRAAQPM